MTEFSSHSLTTHQLTLENQAMGVFMLQKDAADRFMTQLQ